MTDDTTAALVALAASNIPPDVQELLIRGHPDGSVAPGALAKAITAVDADRARRKRDNCRHPNRRGSAMISSDGSSRYDWFCHECGKSGHHETPPNNPDPTPQWHTWY